MLFVEHIKEEHTEKRTNISLFVMLLTKQISEIDVSVEKWWNNIKDI